MAINLNGTFEHNGKKYRYSIDVEQRNQASMDRNIDCMFVNITDEDGRKFSAAWFYRHSIVDTAKEAIENKLAFENSIMNAKKY